MSEKFLQSYVFGEHGKFFVSTCLRESSAMIEPPAIKYYETFAWRMNGDERTDWVADNSGARWPKKAYEQHMEVVKQLHETGKFVEVDE